MHSAERVDAALSLASRRVGGNENDLASDPRANSSFRELSEPREAAEARFLIRGRYARREKRKIRSEARRKLFAEDFCRVRRNDRYTISRKKSDST